MRTSIIIGGIILAAALATGTWFWVRAPSGSVLCTLEVQVCPDGTAISRAGPNCEFAPCPGRSYQPTELKYRLRDFFGEPFFCDPDFYPIAREEEQISAMRHFSEVQENAEEFGTIRKRLGIAAKEIFSSEEQLRIWREHKLLSAIILTPGTEEPNGSFAFGIRIRAKNKTNGAGELINGIARSDGGISIRSRERADLTCPICLSGETRIDALAGPRAIRDIRVGDIVWTLDQAGIRVEAPVIAIGKTPVAEHRAVRLRLDDGRELIASPGHPLADGRRIGDIRAGDVLAGSRVRRADPISYTEPFTYDILPAGVTGFYFANGILLQSTIPQHPR